MTNKKTGPSKSSGDEKHTASRARVPAKKKSVSGDRKSARAIPHPSAKSANAKSSKKEKHQLDLIPVEHPAPEEDAGHPHPDSKKTKAELIMEIEGLRLGMSRLEAEETAMREALGRAGADAERARGALEQEVEAERKKRKEAAHDLRSVRESLAHVEAEASRSRADLIRELAVAREAATRGEGLVRDNITLSETLAVAKAEASSARALAEERLSSLKKQPEKQPEKQIEKLSRENAALKESLTLAEHEARQGREDAAAAQSAHGERTSAPEPEPGGMAGLKEALDRALSEAVLSAQARDNAVSELGRARTRIESIEAKLAALETEAASLREGLAAARQAHAPASDAAASAQAAQATSPSHRVLVVDDNESIRRVIASILQNGGGCEVTTAASGPDALDLVGGAAFDLIVIDVSMTGMDGTALTSAIREKLVGGPPVIGVIPEDAAPGLKEACMAAGMFGVVPKPIDHRGILSLAHDAVGITAHEARVMSEK